jgi:hypothetical protein
MLAHRDAVKIFNGEKIKHGINALVYLVLISPVYFVLHNWVIVIGLLAVRRIVFDTALNIFRGLRYDYISSSTTSILDKISYKFQSKYGYIPYYLIFLLIVLISIIIPYGKS